MIYSLDTIDSKITDYTYRSLRDEDLSASWGPSETTSRSQHHHIKGGLLMGPLMSEMGVSQKANDSFSSLA